MNIVNLTPHALNIACKRGSNLVIEPSGPAARLREEVLFQRTLTPTRGWGEYREIAVSVKATTEIVNLPEPVEGTCYVVSALVAKAAVEQGRDDVLCPGDLVRDEKGVVVGCNGLVLPALTTAVTR